MSLSRKAGRMTLVFREPAFEKNIQRPALTGSLVIVASALCVSFTTLGAWDQKHSPCAIKQLHRGAGQQSIIRSTQRGPGQRFS